MPPQPEELWNSLYTVVNRQHYMDMAPSHGVLHQGENSAPGIKASIYRGQGLLLCLPHSKISANSYSCAVFYYKTVALLGIAIFN